MPAKAKESRLKSKLAQSSKSVAQACIPQSACAPRAAELCKIHPLDRSSGHARSQTRNGQTAERYAVRQAKFAVLHKLQNVTCLASDTVNTVGDGVCVAFHPRTNQHSRGLLRFVKPVGDHSRHPQRCQLKPTRNCRDKRISFDDNLSRQSQLDLCNVECLTATRGATARKLQNSARMLNVKDHYSPSQAHLPPMDCSSSIKGCLLSSG